LYKTESNTEDKMTKMRIALEKNHTLSVIAKKLDFKQYMYLSEGEKKLEGEGENSRARAPVSQNYELCDRELWELYPNV